MHSPEVIEKKHEHEKTPTQLFLAEFTAQKEGGDSLEVFKISWQKRFNEKKKTFLECVSELNKDKTSILEIVENNSDEFSPRTKNYCQTIDDLRETLKHISNNNTKSPLFKINQTLTGIANDLEKMSGECHDGYKSGDIIDEVESLLNETYEITKTLLIYNEIKTIDDDEDM